jgi:hypothetical protein
MSTQWITDRLPTAEEAHWDHMVWITKKGGAITQTDWTNVVSGMPWQPITKPAPYVKPKRWTVEWDCDTKHYKIRLNTLYICTLPELCCDEIAERIENFFNEVMP